MKYAAPAAISPSAVTTEKSVIVLVLTSSNTAPEANTGTNAAPGIYSGEELMGFRSSASQRTSAIETATATYLNASCGFRII